MSALRNRKTVEARARALVRINQQIDDATTKLITLTAKAEQDEAAFAERVAALDAREAALAERDTAFESSAQTVRDELHAHHARIVAAERQLVYRIMSCAGITGEWSSDLRPLPTWQQLRQMVAGLPDDLPATPSAEVISENVREDWTGHTFLPNLTRSINKAAS
jgi:hypothetical protein